MRALSPNAIHKLDILPYYVEPVQGHRREEGIGHIITLTTSIQYHSHPSTAYDHPEVNEYIFSLIGSISEANGQVATIRWHAAQDWRDLARKMRPEIYKQVRDYLS